MNISINTKIWLISVIFAAIITFIMMHFIINPVSNTICNTIYVEVCNGDFNDRCSLLPTEVCNY